MDETESNTRKILIVDDDEINSAVLGKRLDRRGMTVTVLPDAQNVFEVIEKNNIELVLLDIVMPNLDGITVLKMIREKFGKNELPVIMASALDHSFDVVEAFKLGANDYINKPINVDVALARINAHLSTVDLHKDSLRKKEMEAITAMITTYNHEINNPLSIALGCLTETLVKDERSVERLKSSLWRIAEIVKKIKDLTTQERIEFDAYTKSSKTIKVK